MSGTSGDMRTLIQNTQVTTDGAGNATWVFNPPFTTAPRVTMGVGPSADTALVESRITALSATQVTVQVRRAPSVVILGIGVLSFPTVAPGVLLQLVAVAA